MHTAKNRDKLKGKFKGKFKDEFKKAASPFNYRSGFARHRSGRRSTLFFNTLLQVH